MARFKEVRNQQFEYFTKASVFGLFAPIENAPAKAIPYQSMRQRATCQLQILRRDTQTVIIATEQHTNEGASVSNAAEEVAEQVVQSFSLDPAQTRFIEHYTPASYKEQSPGDAEYYDEVSFTWQAGEARRPQWRRLQQEEVKALQDIE